MKVFYSPDYVAARQVYETTRKPGWIAASLLAEPIPLIELVAPEPASQEDLEQVHAPAYVEAVRTGQDLLSARSNGFDWDPGIWTMATAMAGGMVAATREALLNGVAGTLSTGLHHASRDLGKGFCTFNALVLAARTALNEGTESVLILDFDAHYGGGTHSLILSEPRIRQVDLAVASFDQYVCSQNCTVISVKGRTYLEAVATALDAAGSQAGLVLYNAGMDPYQGCPIGGMRDVTAEVLAQRERMVFEWAAKNHLPIAFTIAGGYCAQPLPGPIAELVSLHRLTLTAAAKSR